MVVGQPPTRASAFQPRQAIRDQIDEALAHPGGTGGVVLTQVLSGGGGYGKTQLAASYAHTAISKAGTQLVVWATAAEEQAVITAYAQAAEAVQAPGATGEDPEADAQVFLRWLTTTDRSWLLILDNITDPAHVQRWWPRGSAGWTLATTRLKDDARLTAGGRTRIPIDVYTPEEALAYLHQRLTGDGHAHLYDEQAAKAVIDELGRLPLALGFAAAYMIAQDTTCAEYLHHLTSQPLPGALPEWADSEDYGRPVAAALLLNLHAATAAGLDLIVEPALQLTALLDPDGHPHELWTTQPIRDLLTAVRGPGGVPVSEQEARDAVTVLHRYGLLDRNRGNGPTAVRIHALTARAIRETTPATAQLDLATTAADALLAIWLDVDQPHRDLATVLRTNTDALNSHAQAHLWTADHGGHPVLFRAGDSLLDAGLHTPATAYWETLHHTARQALGADHPNTLRARSDLATSYRSVGRTGEAINLQERVLADRERILGTDHPHALSARSNLAISYRSVGRTGEAINLQERVLADIERILGTDHPNTLRARANLATSYRWAGRAREAVNLHERVLVDSERALGTDSPETLRARNNLATSYRWAGRTSDAIDLEERARVESERILGTDHPNTLRARNNLATSYWWVGRTREAIDLLERVLAESERILGTDHPNTLSARSNLAYSYWSVGRTREAIDLEERVLAESERILGTDHPHTWAAREVLERWHGGRE